jgi:hypothetical protein
VHACFVWFGLLTLWSELALEPASDDERRTRAGASLTACSDSRSLDDLLDSPAFPAASVDAQVLEGIREMSAAARRATRAAEPHATLRQLASARQGAGWSAAVATGLA